MDASERVRQGMGQYPIPVVILARLAVSLTYQGKCIGLALVTRCDPPRPGHRGAGRYPCPPNQPH